MPPREIYTVADMRDWPGATAGVGPPLRLAVFGDPVAHSASPPMHNAALAAAGIDARYTRIHVRPKELGEALELAGRAGFIGVNLTIPHKTAALTLLDTMDDHAARLGAVNTVRLGPDGRRHGSNTDGPGFMRAVRVEFGRALEGQRVLILGAGGGAGRALAAQCLIEGCAGVVLVNRTVEKARLLAAELALRFPEAGGVVSAHPWEYVASPRALDRVDLFVNASSVGLKEDDPSPLSAGMIPSQLRVFDTVYRRDSEPTALIAAARNAGAATAGGLALLLHQGALAFERWFDRPAPLEIMRAALVSFATPTSPPAN